MTHLCYVIISSCTLTISDVLALAASISELSELTRRARTAQWCSLQAADKDNPCLTKYGIDIQSLTTVKQGESPGKDKT